MTRTFSAFLPPALTRSGHLARFQGGCAVFLGVVFLRMLVLFRSSDSVHSLPIDGDMKFYSDWAMRIANGQWTDHQAFYGQPLFAYFLAAIYAVVGYQPFLVLLLQVAVEAGTALLIFQLAKMVFAREDGESAPGPDRARLIGYLAAAGWAFFVPAQAYAAILMPTTYFVAAFWLVVWWTLRRRDGLPRQREFFLLGLFMGFIAMMTANILLLSGLVLAGLFLRQSWVVSLPPQAFARWRTRLGAAALFVGGIGLGASPCWVHNYFVAGEPVLISAHSGVNLWIGNNPDANGYPKIPGGMHADQAGLLKDSITLAEKEAGRPLRRYEVSAHWSAKAHRYIAEHPGAFVRLLGVKLANFWNNYRYDDLGVVISMQEDNVLLPGIGFGMVAVLGLPGLVLAAFRRPKSRWITAAVFIHMGSLMTVFITERYRLAAVPGLLLLGSFGVVEFAGLLLARRWAPTLSYVGLAGAAALIVLRVPTAGDVRDHDDYNTALVDIANQHYDRARPKLQRVYAHNPGNPEAVFALGNLAMAQEQIPLAAQYYRRTLELDPQHGRAMNNLGVIALESGRWEAAQRLFTDALALNPQDAKIYFLLARTRLALHDAKGALEAIDQAIKIAPSRSNYVQLRDEIARNPGLAGS